MNRTRGSRANTNAWYNNASTELNRVLPSLYHDYVNNRYWNTSDGETAFPFTATRTTNAMRVNSAGILEWAPANMVVNSEAIWITGLSVATSSLQGSSPQTGADVYKLIANAAVVLTGNDGLGCASLPVVTTNASQTYCISFYAKAAEVSIARVREPTVTGYRALIDLNTGIVTTETGTSSLTSGMIVTTQNVGDGWWRIVCRRTASGTSQGFNIKQGNSTGDGVSGILLSSIQFEPDDLSVPKKFIATTGTAFYGARFDYDPTTLKNIGLLVEPGVTNNILNSHTYQTGWALTNCSLSTLTTDPMGLQFGRTILEGGVAGTSLAAAAFTTTASLQYNASVFLKRGNTDWVRIRVVNSVFTNGFQCWVNLATGAKGSANLIGTGTYTSGSFQVIPHPNGWYRVTVAGTIGADTSMTMSTQTATGDLSVTNISAGTYEIWGHQVETIPSTASPTSYIPTYAASATRSVDNFTLTSIPWYNQTEGSIYVRAVPAQADSVNTRRLINFSDGTTNNRYEMSRSASQRIQNVSAVGGVATFTPSSTTSTTDYVSFKALMTYTTALRRITLNGDAVVTNATVGPSSGMTQAIIGSTVGIPAANTFGGWIQEIRYYGDGSASDAQLQALTA